MRCGYCAKDAVEGSKFCSQECNENHVVFHITEDLTEEMDITFGATTFPWMCQLTAESYDALKNRPGTHWVGQEKQPKNLIFEKDGVEYLRAWENLRIPFVIHMRIVDKNAKFNAKRLDSGLRPNIQEEYAAAWKENTKDFFKKD